MKKSLYLSIKAFEDKITGIVKESVFSFDPDLVIFPEYTLVFLALIPYCQEITGSSFSDQAFMKIKKKNPDIESIRDIFLYNAPFVRSISDNIFGTLSKNFGLYILAGTYFSPDTPVSQKKGLYNRALVYNPAGNCFYSQDKVFLTDFEKKVTGLSPGTMDAAAGFSVNGWKIGMTICRDTYLVGWETHYSGKDLWIDIKANGEFFTEQQKESFERALPARLIHTDVPYGITLCLTGRFFELFWEGESSLIKKNSTRIDYVQRSDTVKEGDMLFFTLHPTAGKRPVIDTINKKGSLKTVYE